MAMFRSLPLSSNQANALAVLVLLYTGLCCATALALAQQEESSRPHEQRTATTIHNPYTPSSLSTTSETIQNQDNSWYTAVATAAVTPPAPQCWRSAMHVLLWQDHNDSTSNRKQGLHQQDAATLCQSLPDSHQKLLALEIARCHMADLGRNLFSTPTERAKQETADVEVNGGGTTAGHDVEPSNCHEPLTNIDDLYFCLKYLTDSGTNAYTQYVAYVQLLCTRLTQEVFLSHQQEVQQEMARRYQEVASQSVSQMEEIHGLAKLHTDQFHALATELPEQMRVKLTFEIQEQLSASVNEHLGTRLKVQLSNLTHVMQEQATNQALALQRAWEQVATRERQEQTAWWQNSSREIQEQRDAMKLAWERMDALLLGQTTTTTTTGIMSDGRMQSIMAGLEFLLTTLTKGYSWLAFLLYFVTTLNLIWLFTRPRICHGFRAHLFALVLLEAAAELVLLFLVEQNVGVLTEWQRVGLVQELRRWTIFLECTIFVLGLFVSMVFTMTGRLPPPPPHSGRPTTLVDTMATPESFRPVLRRRGTTSNGFMMGINHPQQQQQHRSLYAGGGSHQQPFRPTAQVTPPQLSPPPLFEQPMYYSPVVHEIFGRDAGHAGTSAASDYHNQQQHHRHHYNQFQSPSSFVSLHSNQQQQPHHHQPQHPQPMPPPPVTYPHYYSSPLTSLPARHGTNDMPMTRIAMTSTNRYAHGAATAPTPPPPFPPLHLNRQEASTPRGSRLRNNAATAAAAGPAAVPPPPPPPPLDPVATSRFSLHAHEQQQQQHNQWYQYHQSSSAAASPFVTLVRDSNNNNNPRHRKVAAAASAAAHSSDSGSAKHEDDDDADDADDEGDVFMDALCEEIPQDSHGADAANTVAAAAATTATAAMTTMTTTTPDCWTHENAVVRKLSRKRRANNSLPDP